MVNSQPDPRTAPTVSVVIPTKNRPRFLAATLRTVLWQREVPFEVVIVDDGSSDPMATAVPGTDDVRVQILRHPRPLGVGAARNTGIAASRGRWVATLDDDDLWAPDKLVRQVRALEEAKRAWCYSGAIHFLPGPRAWHVDDPPDPETMTAQLPYSNCVPAGSSNVIAGRRVLDEVGGFDPSLRQVADWDMWLKLLRHSPPTAVRSCDVGYRLHDQNMLLDGMEGVLGEIDEIERRTSDLREGRPVNRKAVHTWMATMFWRSGRRMDARRAHLRALRGGDPSAVLRVLRTLIPLSSIKRTILQQAPPSWPPGVYEWLSEALRSQRP